MQHMKMTSAKILIVIAASFVVYSSILRLSSRRRVGDEKQLPADRTIRKQANYSEGLQMRFTKPVYVSLTLMHGREAFAFECLKSLLNQTVPIDGIFLFLSEEPNLQDRGFHEYIIPHVPLKRLITQNSKIRVSGVPNWGPYRKLIPVLRDKWNEDCLLITVDDDAEYKSTMVQRLVSSYYQFGYPVTGRAWKMLGVQSEKDIFKWKYSRRKRARRYKAEKFVIATHGGGTLYHPAVFHKTPWVLNASLFTSLAPTADDLWYNVARIINGQLCVTIESQRKRIFKSPKLSLFLRYNVRAGNDKQMKRIAKYALAKVNEMPTRLASD